MRQIKIIGLILLSIASFLYSYQKPEKVSSTQKSEVYITLEGAFNQTGEVPIKEGMTMSDLVKKVGVKENACMDSLNMNRSIQAEGSFAQLKHDMNFRRFMCRGQNNVLAESILLAVAHNINKLHNKIQANRTGKHLFELKKTA